MCFPPTFFYWSFCIGSMQIAPPSPKKVEKFTHLLCPFHQWQVVGTISLLMAIKFGLYRSYALSFIITNKPLTWWKDGFWFPLRNQDAATLGYLHKENQRGPLWSNGSSLPNLHTSHRVCSDNVTVNQEEKNYGLWLTNTGITNNMVIT